MHGEVTQALTQEPEHIGRALLAIPENQWYERKSARVAGRELADVEIALANAEGGTLENRRRVCRNIQRTWKRHDAAVSRAKDFKRI